MAVPTPTTTQIARGAGNARGWQRKRWRCEAGQLERRGFYACCRSLSGLKSIWRPVEDLHRRCSELREPARHGQAADHAVVGASLLAIHACAVPKRSPASWLLQGITPARALKALRGAESCGRSLLGRAGIWRSMADLHRPYKRIARTRRTWASRRSRCCRSQLAGDPRLYGAEKIASKLAPTGDNASEGIEGAARCGILRSIAVGPRRHLAIDGRPSPYL